MPKVMQKLTPKLTPKVTPPLTQAVMPASYLKLMLDERARRDTTHFRRQLFPDTGPLRRELYPKHLEFFQAGALHRERIMLAGNRCISPWTPIETGRATRLVAEMIGVPRFDVRSWDGVMRCTKEASGVFLRGIEPAFRVYLDTGAFFDCSRKHRVLTAVGWLSLAQIVLRANGLHCWHTRKDSLASYAMDDCPGDLLLPAGVNSGQERPPSPDDVHRRAQWAFWPGGAGGHKFLYSHAYQPPDPLSILDDPEQIAALCGQFQDPAPSLACLWPKGLRQELALSVGAYGRQQAGPLAPAHPLLRASEPNACCGRRDVASRREPAGHSSPDGALWQQWKAAGQSMSGWWSPGPHRAIFFPSEHVPLVGGQSIVSVVQLGFQPILDFTVKDVHCYEASGVIHHNTGKTELGGYELSYHLTGDYPAWWQGRRFTHPVRAWAAGDTAKTVRDILQHKLMGDVGNFGTGLIPLEKLSSWSAKQGLADAVEQCKVQHESGGLSHLLFKSYDQGRRSFQGTEQHVILLDEEPPPGIYTECLLRTMTTGGIIMLTFTPLLGLSETVQMFLPDGQIPEGEQTGSKYVVNATWDDAPHLTPEQKAEILASIPEYQRDARSRGLPILGAGLIYPLAPDQYTIEPFELPKHWVRAYGMDVGWNWTAAVFGAYDRETDTWYLYHEYKRAQAEPAVHVAGIQAPGKWIRGVIDPAANGRGQDDGRTLMGQYIDLGLDLQDANNAVEAGIYDVWQRLATGKLKIFSSCTQLLAEMRLYRRDEKGKIVKVNDHVCDSMRYLCLSGLEVARAVPVRAPLIDPLQAPSSAAWMA